MQFARNIFVAGICSSLFSNIALATATPPEPNTLKPPAAWIGILVMALFFGVVITISIMSSKRGHQD
jgi:hypothetical protein